MVEEELELDRFTGDPVGCHSRSRSPGDSATESAIFVRFAASNGRRNTVDGVTEANEVECCAEFEVDGLELGDLIRQRDSSKRASRDLPFQIESPAGAHVGPELGETESAGTEGLIGMFEAGRGELSDPLGIGLFCCKKCVKQFR
ncbi:unnamed protein product [Echinostoma caproni]|uniref:FLZ-type domain-containing protein n=1 Tax=Echinostoma caproni TaxID=27848 RepID=A0A183AWJ7_9TREM|nr:unnamed protein product [Echinostoma caproni]